MTMTCKELVMYLEEAMTIVGEDAPVYYNYENSIGAIKCDIEMTKNTKVVRII